MRPLRSFLFVPGDSERKIEKGGASGADALILDLEDSVAPARKAAARQLVAEHLAQASGRGGPALWVRVNPIAEPGALLDLAAVVGGTPAGIVLPKAEGPADVLRLSHCLDALEARDGVEAGSIAILPIATETAAAPFSLGDYAQAGLTRLFGIAWGAEDLSAALGAASNIDADGRWSLTYRMVRSLALLAAKACEIEAVETVYPDFRDIAGFTRSSIAARREGFTARMAIHPDQVPIINNAFTPSADDIAFAEQVVAAFKGDPTLGAVAIDGKMVDRPHVQQALKVLAMRDAFAIGL